MIKIVGVSFNKKGRIYNFSADGFELEIGDNVIVETEKGMQYGIVTTPVREIKSDEYSMPLKNIIRFATKKDKKSHENNLIDADYALERAKEIVEELELDMHLLDASYTFDRKQLLFNFIADERIDFRELARRLASIYKTRIELRQIGVRDKAKEIGGLGPCGRMLCCNTFLSDINSVTINMAKNQMLALNPTKINGACGRLLCCLAYEDDVYTDLRKKLPEVGVEYNKHNVSGVVKDIDILKQKIYVEDNSGNIIEVNVSNGNN